MSEKLLQQLKQAAYLALKSENLQEGMLHLSQALSLFSEETNPLKSDLPTLQEKLRTVNEELEKKTKDKQKEFPRYREADALRSALVNDLKAKGYLDKNKHYLY